MHGSRGIVLNCYRKESMMTRFSTWSQTSAAYTKPNPAKMGAAYLRPIIAVSHFFRLVSVILRITAQPVLLQYLKTVVNGPRNRNVRRADWDSQRAVGGPQGDRTAGYPGRTASPPQTDEARSDSGSCEERSKRPATWIATTGP